MILRISGFLVQNLDRLTTQAGELAFEPQIEDLARVLAIVVFKEKGKAVRVAEKRSADGEVLDFRGLRDGQSLSGGGGGCSAKVEVVSVEEQFEGFRRGAARRGTDEERVQLDGAGEAGCGQCLGALGIIIAG